MQYPSIRTAAEELHAGVITPTELVEETLTAIAERDPDLQAYVTVMREQAQEDAERAEKEMRTGLYRGPLHGIPIAIKDLIAVKGVPTTASSRVLTDMPDTIATADATVVELLRKSGAILIGKTNTYEFAYGPFAPPTRNPWKPTHTPGGSSGGSAVAVAAGMALGAIGTDTGGSIRIPAACCGMTGLKPTYGRVSCAGVIPLSWSLDHVGPIGRNAEDCALLFDAICKYDPRDPNSVSGPPLQSTAGLISGVEGRGPHSLQGLKLGVPQNSFVDPLQPEVRAAWRAALHVFSEEGAEVVPVELPRPTMQLYRTIQKPEASLAHIQRQWFPQRSEKYSDLVKTRLLEGQNISAVDYLQALHEKRQLTGTMRAILRNVDAFVLPTLPTPAIDASLAGEMIEIDGQQERSTDAFLRLTIPFSLTGLPAISFPCSWSTDGLPIGLQVVGKPFEEATVLRIAHAYQQLTEWHLRQLL